MIGWQHFLHDRSMERQRDSLRRDGDRRLTTKSAVGILDALEVAGVVLVGDRFGAELGWKLAATHPERFTGLVVIDCGHPGMADVNGSSAEHELGVTPFDEPQDHRSEDELHRQVHLPAWADNRVRP